MSHAVANRRIFCYASPRCIRIRILERLLRVYRRSPDLPKLIVTGVRGFAAKSLEAMRPPRLSSPAGFRAKNFTSCTEPRGVRLSVNFRRLGMPVLEAMAAGVPLACSDIPVLREVASDCALYFDPLDEEAMHRALVRWRAGRFRWKAVENERPSSPGEDRARDVGLSEQVFELNLGVGFRVAIFHDDRSVERQAPVAALAGGDSRASPPRRRRLRGSPADLRRWLDRSASARRHRQAWSGSG